MEYTVCGIHTYIMYMQQIWLNKCIAIQFKKWVFTHESPVLKTMTMSRWKNELPYWYIFFKFIIIIITEMISLEGICILVKHIRKFYT